MTTALPTVGIIYPGHAAEDEYPAAAEVLGARLPVVHTYGTDLHAVPELLDLGAPHRLAGAVAELRDLAPQAVMWACTSGSFVFGPDGVHRQAADLADVAGVPASSTTLAFIDAITDLGLSRVAVAASYPADVADLFADVLAASGVEVVAASQAGIDTAAQVGTLSPGDVRRLASGADHPHAQAVLVPDTAMHTLGVLPDLEERLGKPVLTANQVTIWQGLRLAGARPHAPALGTLFSRRQDDDHQ